MRPGYREDRRRWERALALRIVFLRMVGTFGSTLGLDLRDNRKTRIPALWKRPDRPAEVSR